VAPSGLFAGPVSPGRSPDGVKRDPQFEPACNEAPHQSFPVMRIGGTAPSKCLPRPSELVVRELLFDSQRRGRFVDPLLRELMQDPSTAISGACARPHPGRSETTVVDKLDLAEALDHSGNHNGRVSSVDEALLQLTSGALTVPQKLEGSFTGKSRLVQSERVFKVRGLHRDSWLKGKELERRRRRDARGRMVFEEETSGPRIGPDALYALDDGAHARWRNLLRDDIDD
jgi:hypothetical protein